MIWFSVAPPPRLQQVYKLNSQPFRIEPLWGYSGWISLQTDCAYSAVQWMHSCQTLVNIFIAQNSFYQEPCPVFSLSSSSSFSTEPYGLGDVIQVILTQMQHHGSTCWIWRIKLLPRWKWVKGGSRVFNIRRVFVGCDNTKSASILESLSVCSTVLDVRCWLANARTAISNLWPLFPPPGHTVLVMAVA